MEQLTLPGMEAPPTAGFYIGIAVDGVSIPLPPRMSRPFSSKEEAMACVGEVPQYMKDSGLPINVEHRSHGWKGILTLNGKATAWVASVFYSAS
jgi:hypothetical protein